MKNALMRCTWPKTDPLMIKYHDEEWGIPLFDDNKLFEFLVLDAFQAGLSWQTILHKRENFKKAFYHFDATKIAKMNETQINQLMQNEGIVRNKLKIKAAVKNAQSFLNLQEKHNGFYHYLWQFTDGKTIINKWHDATQIPTTSTASDNMSKALRKEGFSFVGSTICYAFMQAAGMVNDHLISCFRYKEINQLIKNQKNN